MRHLVCICIFAHFCIIIWSRFLLLFLNFFICPETFDLCLVAPLPEIFDNIFRLICPGTFRLISDYSGLIFSSPFFFPVLFIIVIFLREIHYFFVQFLQIFHSSFSSFFHIFQGCFCCLTGLYICQVSFSPISKLAGTYMGSPLAPIICCTFYTSSKHQYYCLIQ